MTCDVNPGARLLSQLGWCSLRSGRGEKWPVMEEWFANQLVTVRMQYDQAGYKNLLFFVFSAENGGGNLATN